MNFVQKFKYILLICIFFLISSCGQGCIEPDDFGNYETQILTLSAQGSNFSSCAVNFDDATNINSHGSDIRTILSGTNDVKNELACYFIDENGRGVDYTSNEFTDEDRRDCLTNVQNLCNQRILMSGGVNQSWIQTSPRDEDSGLGVNLYQNSRIFVTANGDISFGSRIEPIISYFNNSYHSAIGHSYKENGDNLNYNVTAGDVSAINISGSIGDNQGSPDDLSRGEWRMDAHIGFSNIYAYIDSHPNDEVNNYPIEPDPRLWNCFSASVNYKTFANRNDLSSEIRSNCYAENYSKDGYYTSLRNREIGPDGNITNPTTSLISKALDNDVASDLYVEKYGTEYDISNVQNLGKYGGAILTNSALDADIINSQNQDPALTYNIDPERYRIINYDANKCQYQIEDNNNAIINVETIDNNGRVILFPNHSLTFSSIAGQNCSDSDIREVEYVKTVTFEESGYVRFFNTSLTSGNNCNINIALANYKINEHINYDLDADSNKIQTIIVNPKPSEISSLRSFIDAINRPIYVREGQKMLFLPNSWRWNDNNGCDINSLMHIEYRPAIICENAAEHDIFNLNCDRVANSCTDSNQDQIIQSDYQCFDITNYHDKLSDLDLEDDQNEGLVEIGFFDGNAGNFVARVGTNDNYLNLTDSQDNNNRYIFSSNHNIEFNRSGRLKFLFLGDRNQLELRNIDSSYFNPHSGVNYNGSNGFKINIGSFLSFSNGENLQVKLCDDPTSSGNCNNGDALENIIDHQNPNFVNNYSFRSDGILTDITDSRHNDYYEHNRDQDNLRLSFSIFNPNSVNINDCIIGKSGNAMNCSNDDDCGGDNIACCNGIVTRNPYYLARYCDSGQVLINNECCPASNIAIDAGANPAVTCAGNAGNLRQSDINNFCSILSPDCYEGKICTHPDFANEGSYEITVRVPSNNGPDSLSIINNIISPILTFLDGDEQTTGFVEKIYVNTVQNSIFITLIKLFSILVLTFYGISYFLGLVNMKQQEIMGLFLKIGIIYLLISPNGWYWYKEFFVNTFKDGVNYITFLMANTFDRDPEILNAVNNYDFSDKSILFKSSERLFGILFNDVIHKKILGLIFHNFFGIIYVIFIYWAIYYYFLAFFASVSFFLIAQIFISILLAFGPIFIMFMFFRETYGLLFRNWYEQLLGLSLQQALLILFISFFNNIIYQLIIINFNYRICWGPVWDIPIFNISILEFWSLPNMGTAMGSGADNYLTSGIPKLFAIIFIFFMAKMMIDFIEMASKLSATIVGNINIADAAVPMAKEALKSISTTGSAFGSYVLDQTGAKDFANRKKSEFMDKHLDSGEIADKRHAAQKAVNAKDRSMALSLQKAGDRADLKFIKDHGLNKNNLSEEQMRALYKNRDASMVKHAAKLGLDPNSSGYKKLLENRKTKYTDRELNTSPLKMAKQYAAENNKMEKAMNKAGSLISKNTPDKIKSSKVAKAASMAKASSEILMSDSNASLNKLGFSTKHKTRLRNANESKYGDRPDSKDPNQQINPALDSNNKGIDPSLDKKNKAIDPKLDSDDKNSNDTKL